MKPSFFLLRWMKGGEIKGERKVSLADPRKVRLIYKVRINYKDPMSVLAGWSK